MHIAAIGKSAIVADAYMVLAGNVFRFYSDAATSGSVNGVAEQVANDIGQ